MCTKQVPGTVIDAGDTEYPRDAGDTTSKTYTPLSKGLQGEKLQGEKVSKRGVQRMRRSKEGRGDWGGLQRGFWKVSQAGAFRLKGSPSGEKEGRPFGAEERAHTKAQRQTRCIAHWRNRQTLVWGVEGEEVRLGRGVGCLCGASSIPGFQAVKDGLFQWSPDLEQ